MSLWILDTNHVTYLQNSHPNVLQHLSTVNPKDVAITAITAEEQIRGWFKFMDVNSDRCICLLFTGSLKGIIEKSFRERAQMRLKYKK